MRRTCAAVLLAALCATTAQATDDTIFISGFDAADTQAGTARNSFEFVEVLGNGGDPEDMRIDDLADSGAVIHCGDTLCGAAGNGGSNTSRKAVRVTVANDEQAYWRPCEETDAQCEKAEFPVDLLEMTVGFSFHIPSDPSGSRELLRIVENDATPDGANVRLNVVSGVPRIFLYYDDQLIASPALDLHPFACAPADAEDVVSILVSCTSDTGQCPNGTHDCTANNPTPRAYYPGLELRQVVNGANAVTVELRLAGKLIAQVLSLDPISDVGSIRTFYFGAVGTEPATMDVRIDDVVVAAGSRAGHGWVDALVPVCAGSPCDVSAAWNVGGSGAHCGCDETTAEYGCVDDYLDSCESYAYFTGAGRQNIQRDNINKIETWALSDLASVAPGAPGSVRAVILGQGRAGTASNRIFDADLTVVGGGSPATMGPVEIGGVGSGGATPRLIGSLTQGPSIGLGSAWEITDINNLRLTVRTTANTQNFVEVHAVLVYVQVERPTVLGSVTLLDGNDGTDDGEVTLCFQGNSITRASQAANCVGGATPGADCSQESCCSWDDLACDKPINSCGAGTAESPFDDSVCKTCTGRRNESPNAAGFPCSNPDDSECACPAGNCTGQCVAGTCQNNPAAPCSTDAQCDLGLCDDAGTCKDACPDISSTNRGTCPTEFSAFPGKLLSMVRSDRTQTYIFPASTSSNNAACFDRMISGLSDSTCASWGSAIVGAGKCTCSAAADCQRVSGGTCSGNLCTASDSGQELCQGWNDLTNIAPGRVCSGTLSQSCVVNSDCSATQTCVDRDACETGKCQFDNKCDILVTQSVLADQAFVGIHDPECETPQSAVHSAAVLGRFIGGEDPCSPPTAVLCSTDADCGHPDAKCVGRLQSTTRLCMSGSLCTINRPSCRVTADCPYGTCSVNDPTNPRRTGVCACTADADCETAGPYDCENGICRKHCTSPTDAGCTSLGGECENDAVDGQDQCKGVCTAPSRSMSCSSGGDADCEYMLAAFLGVPAVTVPGSCIKVCSGNTDQTCAADTDCTATQTCVNRCSCTGIDSCMDQAAVCPRSRAAWINRTGGHDLALDNFDLMRAEALAAGSGETDGYPRVMFITDPPIYDSQDFNRTSTSCGEGYAGLLSDEGYLQRVDQHLLAEGGFGTRFGHVIPTGEFFHLKESGQSGHVADGVHLSQAGAEAYAEKIADYLNAFSVCAHQKRTPWQYPQRYCRNVDGTFTGVACTPATQFADCTVVQTCETRPCVGQCTASTCDDQAGLGCSTDDDCCPATGDACNPNEFWDGTITTTTTTTTTSTSTTTTTMAAAAENWGDNAIAHWDGCEDGGGAQAKANGTCPGTDCNLTQTGSVTQDVSNEWDGLAACDIDSGDILECANATCNELMMGSVDQTWCMAMRPNTGTADEEFVDAQDTSPSSGVAIFHNTGTGVDRAEGRLRGAASNVLQAGNNSAPLNTWTHVCVRYDETGSSSDTQQIFINGWPAGECNGGSTPGAHCRDVAGDSDCPGGGNCAINTGTTNQLITGTLSVTVMTQEPFKINGDTAEAGVFQWDDLTVWGSALTESAICRLCSCGAEPGLNESPCTCDGTNYVTTGRNASQCNSCTLPACNLASPPTL